MHDRDSKRVRAWAVLRLLLALGVGLLPTLGWAEDPAPVPEHAFVSYGDEWRCDRGFNRVDDRCEEISVPENAHFDYTGIDWECERGYKRVKERCEEIPVPEHAFLNHSGNDWKCDRGFKREGNRCSPE